MKSYFKSLFEEQSEERFFSLKLTKFVLWLFGGVFIVTALISLRGAITLELKLTSEGINYFIFDLFKAPVAVVGFALPILGLIGLNHRSEQTKKQITATGEQNRFANYFKHLEEFKKHVDSLEERKQIDLTKIRMLHDNLFSLAYRFGDYDVHCSELETICDFASAIDDFLKAVKGKNELLRLPEEFGYLEMSQSGFGMKNVIPENLFNVDAVDEDTRIEFNIDYLWKTAEFIDLLRNMIAFSNNGFWTSRLDVLASGIRYKLRNAEDAFQREASFKSGLKEVEEMIKDIDKCD